MSQRTTPLAWVIHPRTGQQPAESPLAGTRQFRSAKEDKTAKLVLGILGVLVVGVLMLIGLSEKGKQKIRKSGEASLGRPHQEQMEQGATPVTTIVPGSSMQPVPEDKQQEGDISARDIENTKKTRSAMDNGGDGAAPTARTLAQIPAFHPENTQGNDNWAPPPFAASRNEAEAGPEKAMESALAKPSLVFTAASESLKTAGVTQSDELPTLDLGIGSRLSARLASAVTSAVNQPVVALIEYNYQHDGVVMVPAGSKAVGRLVQADRSGYVQLHFDHLEMPGGANVAIDALATDLDLGPLKGRVTGTHRGQNFAVRALTGVGQMSAMLVGQSGSGINGAVSEADLMRSQMAENVGRAGDQEVMQLTLSEHPVVTLPAGLRIYVVFEKRPSQKNPAGQYSSSPGMGNLAQMPVPSSQ